MMNWSQLLNPSRLAQSRAYEGDLFEEDRSPYEADYGRILFSTPFRRLNNKTQVFPMPENDHVHSRLTHSLEVANVGQTLGKMVGRRLIRDRHLKGFSAEHLGQIVASACLAHDIGNPPFGHHGERAISDFFRKNMKAFENFVCDDHDANLLEDLNNFEGNAQGFRVLSHLYMCKGDGGLRLTFATLGAFSKYPQSCQFKGERKRPGGKKYGYGASEAIWFEQVAAGCGLMPVEGCLGAWHRHPLAYLMEAADDICYQILDIEDGLAMGLLEREAFVYLLEPIIGQRCRDWEISRIRATAIQLWISEVADAFMKAEPDMMKGQQEHPLMEIIPSRNVIAQLNQTAVEACYKAPVVVKREVAASRVITELLEHLTGCALSEDPGQLLKTLVAGELPSSKIKRFQLAVDYVSGMTDRFALSLYRQLAGFDLAMG